MNETQWMGKVREIADLYGFDVYHTHRSDRSDAGWPDLVLRKEPRLIFAELKSQKGRTSKDQVKWLNGLVACGQEVALWRPDDLPTVLRVLGPRKERATLTL